MCSLSGIFPICSAINLIGIIKISIYKFNFNLNCNFQHKVYLQKGVFSNVNCRKVLCENSELNINEKGMKLT